MASIVLESCEVQVSNELVLAWIACLMAATHWTRKGPLVLLVQ